MERGLWAIRYDEAAGIDRADALRVRQSQPASVPVDGTQLRIDGRFQNRHGTDPASLFPPHKKRQSTAAAVRVESDLRLTAGA